MSLNEENLNFDINERRPSSNPLITAWQIQSTLKNMEQFIKFIGQFDDQRQQLEKILPLIQRIKKIQEEKQFFGKQILDLGKTLSPFDRRQETLLKSENKQKSLVEKHQRHLSNITSEVNALNGENIKKISQLKKIMQGIVNKRSKDREEKKQRLMKELNNCIKDHMNLIENRLSSQSHLQKKCQIITVSDQFIEQHINQKLTSKDFFKQHDFLSQSQLPPYENSLEQKYTSRYQTRFKNTESLKTDLVQRFNQLGQIKCKLFSLQDKKRKITVKNILINKKQINIQNSQAAITNKRFKVIKAQQNKILQFSQKQDMTHKKENGLFRSIFAMFSSDNKKTQLKEISKINFQGKKDEKQITLTKNEIPTSNKEIQQKLQQVDDKQVRLKIAQFLAQILELREHMNIVINQNLFDQVLGLIRRLRVINDQLRSFVQQVTGVIFVLQRETQMRKVSSFNCLTLKENQQIKFFHHFINERLKIRQLLMKNLFGNIGYCISVARKYITKRLNEIQSQYLIFIEENHNKDKKIKAVQSLQSKPQFNIINSGLDSLSCEINQLVENKLRPLQMLLDAELGNFILRFNFNDGSNHNRKNKSISKLHPLLFHSGQFQRILSYEIDTVEKILFQTRNKSHSITRNIEQNNIVRTFNVSINHQAKLKPSMQEQLFHFYDELNKKILNIFYDS